MRPKWDVATTSHAGWVIKGYRYIELKKEDDEESKLQSEETIA